MREILWAMSVLGAVLIAGSSSADDYLSVYDEEVAKRGGASPEVEKRIAALETEVKELKEAEGKADDASTFSVYWDKGLRMQTADKNVKLKLGGRIMWDVGGISQDKKNKEAYGDLEGGTEFRRVRLYTSGDIYKDYFFKLQFDFAGGDADLKDAYLGMRNLPFVGHVKGGHFKEPFGLEEITSSKYITFMERALPIEAFAPSRNTGLMIYNHAFDKKMTWALGVFRDTDDTGMGLSDSGCAITGRLTGCPWYADKGSRLLHLGIACSCRNQPDDEKARYRSRPEWHLSSKRFVDTGTLSGVDDVNLVGLEAALLLGPLSFQTEYVHASADRDRASGGPFDGDGFYFQASYWLTGEHRKYKQKDGCFSRVSPKKNFSLKDGGWGAWEVAARYSCLDLNDGDVEGGKLGDITLGVNWHVNPNMRVMLNYIHADASKPDNGKADMFGMRFQVDF